MTVRALLVALVLGSTCDARADGGDPGQFRGRLGLSAGLIVVPPWAFGEDNHRGGTAGGSLSFELVRVTRYRHSLGWLWGGRTRILHESENSLGSVELTAGVVVPIEPLWATRIELDVSVGVVGGERRRDGQAAAHFGLILTHRVSFGWNLSPVDSIAFVVEHVGWFSQAAQSGFPLVVSVTYAGEWE